MLIAYSSAPGTVAPDRPGDYGVYATAIAEMLRAPGTDLDNAFTHIRSRTHLTTEGQQTPWHVSAITEQIELVPPQAAASAAVAAPPPPRQARPMREIGPDEAYALAIEMDTLDGYVGFVEAYPGHPYSERVWPMIRSRREAIAWMRAQQINTPQSYWTYLRRYPNGMYAYDAERRLRRLGAPFAAPQGFAMVEFDDVPMALIDEPREYREVYRVGPRPPRILYAAAIPAFIAALAVASRRDGGRDDWRRDGRRGDGRGDGRGGGGRRGAGALPVTAVALPAVQGLTAAPRRDPPPPGAERPGRFGPRGGFAGRPPSGAPGTPGTAIAPSTVTPNTPNTLAPNCSRRRPVRRRVRRADRRTHVAAIVRRAGVRVPLPARRRAQPWHRRHRDPVCRRLLLLQAPSHRPQAPAIAAQGRASIDLASIVQADRQALHREALRPGARHRALRSRRARFRRARLRRVRGPTGAIAVRLAAVCLRRA